MIYHRNAEALDTQLPNFTSHRILLNKQKLTSANTVLHLPETGKYIVLYKKNIWIFTILWLLLAAEKIKKKKNSQLHFRTILHWGDIFSEWYFKDCLFKSEKKCFINNKYFSDFHGENFIVWFFMWRPLI